MTARRPGRIVGPARSRRAPINPQAELRAVLGLFATGVTVITAGGPQPHGMTANAFTSVSLEPPMVLCCVTRTARMHASILAAGGFAVSILSADQHGVARHFADWRRPAGAAQFDAVATTPGPATAAPVIDDALAWVECTLAQVHDGGDHSIFVGDVQASGRGGAAAALTFFAGDYQGLGRAAPGRREAS